MAAPAPHAPAEGRAAIGTRVPGSADWSPVALRPEVRDRITAVALHVAKQLAHGEGPALQIGEGGRAPVLALYDSRHADWPLRLTRLLWLLAEAHKGLERPEGRLPYTSLLYLTKPLEFFSDTKKTASVQLTMAIDDASGLLNVSRGRFGLVVAGAGIVFGAVELRNTKTDDVWFASNRGGAPLSGMAEEYDDDDVEMTLTERLGGSGIVLTVESEAFCAELEDAARTTTAFGAYGKPILVPSGGVFSHTTLAFLASFHRKHKDVPILCVTDYNISGAQIITTARYGAKGRGGAARQLDFIRWLGLRSEWAGEEALREQRQPMSEHDKSRAGLLHQRLTEEGNQRWADEVKTMATGRFKMEAESAAWGAGGAEAFLARLGKMVLDGDFS